jgi:hypothetical protein
MAVTQVYPIGLNADSVLRPASQPAVASAQSTRHCDLLALADSEP